MKIRHWQDMVSLALGAWLVISPMALGFTGAEAWCTEILGLFVIVFAIEGLLLPSYLEEVGEIAVGGVLVLVPWAAGYDSRSATGNSVLIGMLVMVFAIWEMMTDREFQAWWTSFSRRHGE
ncbi:MAG: SPW repeat protein [Betaproteobacteria bacterium]